jgi:hypothetical protein
MLSLCEKDASSSIILFLRSMITSGISAFRTSKWTSNHRRDYVLIKKSAFQKCFPMAERDRVSLLCHVAPGRALSVSLRLRYAFLFFFRPMLNYDGRPLKNLYWCCALQLSRLNSGDTSLNFGRWYSFLIFKLVAANFNV